MQCLRDAGKRREKREREIEREQERDSENKEIPQLVTRTENFRNFKRKVSGFLVRIAHSTVVCYTQFDGILLKLMCSVFVFCPPCSLCYCFKTPGWSKTTKFPLNYPSSSSSVRPPCERRNERKIAKMNFAGVKTKIVYQNKSFRCEVDCGNWMTAFIPSSFAFVVLLYSCTAHFFFVAHSFSIRMQYCRYIYGVSVSLGFISCDSREQH